MRAGQRGIAVSPGDRSFNPADRCEVISGIYLDEENIDLLTEDEVCAWNHMDDFKKERALSTALEEFGGNRYEGYSRYPKPEDLAEFIADEFGVESHAALVASKLAIGADPWGRGISAI